MLYQIGTDQKPMAINLDDVVAIGASLSPTFELPYGVWLAGRDTREPESFGLTWDQYREILGLLSHRPSASCPPKPRPEARAQIKSRDFKAMFPDDDDGTETDPNAPKEQRRKNRQKDDVAHRPKGHVWEDPDCPELSTT